jgi:tetratricopeptide (TPR) repeat protein
MNVRVTLIGVALAFLLQVLCAQNVSGSSSDPGATAPQRNIWVLWKQVADAFKEKNYALAISLCTTALASMTDPLQRAHFLSERGYAHFQLNQLDAAMSDYNEALRVQPGYAPALSGRGAIFQTKRQTELALNDYAAATKSDPGYLAAHDNRAYIYQSKGDLEKAIAGYSAAIRLYPTYADSYWVRGIAYFEKGELDHARADLRKAQSLNGELSPGTMNNVAWFRATCPDASFRDGREALAMAVHACAKARHNKWVYLGTLAAAYAECGKFQEAIKFQKQALSISDVPEKVRPRMQQRLSLYEQHKPYRQKPK